MTSVIRENIVFGEDGALQVVEGHVEMIEKPEPLALVHKPLLIEEEIDAPEVTVPVELPAPAVKFIRVSKLQDIRDALGQESYDSAELSNWITIEIASVTEELRNIDPTEAFKVKACTDQVKALRELGKQLADTDSLNKRDALNFDGPKFLFVMQEYMAILGESMRDAGMSDEMMQNVFKHFRDKLVEKEPIIRRETAKR